MSKRVNPMVGFGRKERIDQAVWAVTFMVEEEDVKSLEEACVTKEMAGL